MRPTLRRPTSPQPIRRGRLREKRSWVPAFVYVAIALLLGTQGPDVLGPFVPRTTSPLSSGSAIAMLTAIASGMLAVTAIVFSLALVGYQIGMSAYSPRLVTELSRGRLLSHALGVFAGTFLYALAAIRSVDIEGAPGVNTAVIFVALLWLLASIVVLVRLVPSLSKLTIPHVLADIGQRGRDAIDRIFPPYRGGGRGEEAPHGGATTSSSSMRQVLRLGEREPVQYILAIDVDALLQAAVDGGGRIHVPHAVGDRVLPGETLAMLVAGSEAVSERRLRRGFVLGHARHLERDPAYALRLLVDIAIRALSPAINDPSTAVNALDHIEPLLRKLGKAELAVGHVADEGGTVRVEHEMPRWDELLSLALVEIHHYGRGSVQVQRRMGALLRDLEDAVPEQRRHAVRRFAEERQKAVGTDFDNELERAAAKESDRQGLGHRVPPDLSRAG